MVYDLVRRKGMGRLISKVLPSCMFVALTTLALPAQVQKQDPIADLLASLDPHGMWINGIAPMTSLPENATPEQLFNEVGGKFGLDAGHVTSYWIVETRKLKIDSIGEPNVMAILAATNLGPKILLAFPQGPKSKSDTHYWTRLYDVKQPFTPVAPPRNPTYESQIAKILPHGAGSLAKQLELLTSPKDYSVEKTISEILKKKEFASDKYKPARIVYMTSVDNEASHLTDYWHVAIVETPKGLKLLVFGGRTIRQLGVLDFPEKS